MESLLGLIGQFMEAILSVIPRLTIIRATHKAVKWKCGKNPVAVQPGLNIYWPVVTELDLQVTARQTLSIATQHLVTADGVSVAIGAYVVYTIKDVVLAIGEKNYDVDDTISDLAQAALVEEITSLDYDELLEGIQGGRESDVYQALTQNLNEDLSEYGVSVERAGLTDFAKCRVYRLLSD